MLDVGENVCEIAQITTLLQLIAAGLDRCSNGVLAEQFGQSRIHELLALRECWDLVAIAHLIAVLQRDGCRTQGE